MSDRDGEHPGAIDPALVAERLAVINERIRAAGGDPTKVAVTAVTKTFGPSAVRAALAAGIVDVGENYATELLATAGALAGEVPRPRWHFLGVIQRRDVPKLAGTVTVFEGVDRVAEGVAIAKYAPGSTVYVEIDSTGIDGRAGVRPDDAGALIVALRELDLDVAGVMTIAPAGGGTAAAAAFAAARAVADEFDLVARSMGMSDDLELAVAAGSTAVRIGRALFGGRAPHPRGATMGS